MPANNVFICTPERAAQQLTVTIPGVGELRSIKQTMDGIPTPEALAMVMLGQISPALAPMTAVLRICDVILEIQAVFKTVPNVISDPGSLLSAIKKLEKSIGFVEEFLPGVVYVKAVRDMLIMVEQILSGMAGLITRWVVEMQAISQALESASLIGDTGLSASGYCSQARLIEVQQATQVSIQDVGQILKVVKLIADIVKSIVFFDLPGISQVTDEIDTIAALIPAVPGDVSLTEQNRLLTIAENFNTLANKIHNLTVLVTEIVGS